MSWHYDHTDTNGDRWEVDYCNTGGGCMCWVATHVDTGAELTFGTADGHWGWSDILGLQMGENPSLDDAPDSPAVAAYIGQTIANIDARTLPTW